MELGEQGRAEQLSRRLIVALAKTARHFEGGLAIAIAGGLAHREQGIGDFRHGADHHDRPVRQPALDDLADAIDGLRVLNGGPAEFHDDHGRGSSLRGRVNGSFTPGTPSPSAVPR